jgi:NAD(P)-dependent dehydrogenase (short-subunit alcohol dehydrogenase family)
MPIAGCAIITGGTGALGQVVTSAFLAQGKRVVVPWVAKSERDALARASGPALDDGRLLLVEADVAEESGAAEVLRACPGSVVDVLVNGVGGFAGGGHLHETELEVWDRMYRMNVRTTAAMTRAVLRGMRERNQGSVVCIASQAALTRPAGLAAYSAAKSAVLVLVETVQRELAATGVRINAIAPGTIDTPANRAAMPRADTSAWTSPARIAEVILWLASPAAAAVRGATVPV